MLLIQDFRYRPEIDGLRALAVLSVVLFHASFGFPGGFVGVDVFFVISGFLITSLIWKDLENGKFTLLSFWEKRARRIAPALIVVTVATLIAGWFFLLPPDYRMLGKAVKAQSYFMANYFYLHNTDYFDSAADEMPLLHTWSLAVEEQFYLFVPLMLAAVFRFKVLRKRTFILTFIALAMAGSFSISVHGLSTQPSEMFYLLPGRAWELLLGSFVAFLPRAGVVRKSQMIRELLSLASLGLILYPMFIYSSITPFPGLAALPPCLGTALFIWANGGELVGRPSFTSRLFSWRPIVFVGAISYSLYLWHWPLLAFGKYLSIGGLFPIHRVALVGTAFVLSAFSWKFVELPFRNRKLGTSTRSMYAYAVTSAAVLLIFGQVCKTQHGFLNRITPQQQKYVDAASNTPEIHQLFTADIKKGKLVPLGVKKASPQQVVLVWGDSHAMAALPALDIYLKEIGWKGVAATHSSTAPVLNWYKMINRRALRKESINFGNAILDYVRQQKIKHVLLIARWTLYQDEKGNDAGDGVSRNEAILATVKQLVAIGVQPWVMLQVPTHEFNIPSVLSRRRAWKSSVYAYCAKPLPTNEFTSVDPSFMSKLEMAGVRIIDPKPAFLEADAKRYIFESDGIVLYRDNNHLTLTGSKQMLLPVFRETLKLETSTAWQTTTTIK